MAQKRFVLDGDLPVTVYKRRGNRNLRLSVTTSGEIRVSIPAWAPYSAGLTFARSKHEWILAQRRPREVLKEGLRIGKAHHLHFVAKPGVSKPSSRVSPGVVTVTYPHHMSSEDAPVQQAARVASIRALRIQAEQLLPQRLARLAEAHDFSYNGVSVRQLKSRWGSCDQDKAIVLSIFLMQLPWEYIDYVLLHELVHTRIMRHGPDFWNAMTELMPDAKRLRKELHQYRPALGAAPAVA